MGWLKGYRLSRFPSLALVLAGLAWADVQPLMYRFIAPLPDLEVEIYHDDPLAND